MKQSLTNFVSKKLYTKGIIRLGSLTYILLIDLAAYHIRTKKLWIRSTCLYVCMHYILWRSIHDKENVKLFDNCKSCLYVLFFSSVKTKKHPRKKTWLQVLSATFAPDA